MRRLFTAPAIIAALACALTLAASAAAPERPAHPIAGTYLLDVRHDGFPPAAALVTLTRDGGFIATDVSDQGAGGLSTIDSPVHGVWRHVDANTLTATTLYFGFDPEGIPKWISRTTGVFHFNRDFTAGRGELTVFRFGMDQDPLDEKSRPQDVLKGKFTARRVMAR